MCANRLISLAVAAFVLAGLLAAAAAGDSNVTQGRPTRVIGCAQLAQLEKVFPIAKAAGFTGRLQIRTQYPREPVSPGRCGGFWTTYKGAGSTVDVELTLYRSSKDVGAALAEPLYGRVHVLPNGARVRILGPSPVSVNGMAGASTGAVSAFRDLFIGSISISTSMKPVPVMVQLRIHRLIENAALERLHTKH